MAETIDFKGSNAHFGPPPGEEERCGHLHCFLNGSQVVSAWKLTDKEKEEGIVYVSIWSGRQVWPLFVGDESTVRGMCADFGKPF